ncbi:MAG: tyrosine--tRNA ligase, partial [Patescibacteria group bacterium]|nr:tyrosine--tRNA ligase [Patescibacteria group bacterium]
GALHLGHVVVLGKLAAFQKLGHRVILLIGDFTAMIGDPTDKTATRRSLSREEVRVNQERYLAGAALFLHFDGENPAELRRNSEWHDTLTFERVLEIASHLTVDQLLKRDMFERRSAGGKPIYLHEFLYPLMQGYDGVALEVDGEIGASDQTFNMLVGRTLEKQLLGREKFVLTTKLLTDPTGRKMSKSEGNVIWLSDTSDEQFGKVMRWPDTMIVPGFELCTELAYEELHTIQDELQGGANPRDLKLRLAREVTARLSGEEAAHEAEARFLATFSGGEAPEDMPEIAAKENEALIDVLARSSLVASKTEARRLIESGAVETAAGERLTDPRAVAPRGGVLRIGKRRFLRIR